MNKTIFVFGGSRGIARVFANKRVNDGDQVYVFARTFEKRFTIEPNFISVDFINQEYFLKELKSILKKVGKVDIILFAQRYRGEENLWENEISTSVETIKNTIDTVNNNFKKNAAVVVISSNAARNIAVEQPIGYHMTKAAIIQMARYYAVSLASQGVRVNIVSPAITLKPENIDFYNSNLEIKNAFVKAIPLQRMARAEDICNTIDFLTGDMSSFITGQELIVDGGLSLLTPEVLIRNEF